MKAEHIHIEVIKNMIETLQQHLEMKDKVSSARIIACNRLKELENQGLITEQERTELALSLESKHDACEEYIDSSIEDFTISFLHIARFKEASNY